MLTIFILMMMYAFDMQIPDLLIPIAGIVGIGLAIYAGVTTK